MDRLIQVSVVLCTYNPDLEKLIRTLYSILIQKDVSFEIIVTDDGSEIDYFDEIEVLFKKWGFQNYILSKLAQNMGTVQNLLNGIKLAKGKYIKSISPGDLLYYDKSLADLCIFCDNECIQCVIGSAIYYNDASKHIKLIHTPKMPNRPSIYGKYVPKSFLKLEICLSQHILGAAMFWTRAYALCYISEIVPFCKYVEDTPSTMLAVMNGEKVRFYKNNIVWYEHGFGVSTSKNNIWMEKLMRDNSNAREYAMKKYPSRLWDLVSIEYASELTPKKRRFLQVLRHPYWSSIRILRSVFFKEEYTDVGLEFEKKLQVLLDKAHIEYKKLLNERNDSKDN